MTTPLASVVDLEQRLGEDVDSGRGAAAIMDASAAVVAYCGGWEFVRATRTVTVKVPPSRRVRLGQLPVHSVTTVVDLKDNPLTFEFDGIDTVSISMNLDDFAFEPWSSDIRNVKITYDGGFDTVPDDIVAVVCQIAGRALGTTPQDAALSSERLGEWSVSVRGAAASGALGLLLPERSVLDRYMSRARTIGVTT